MIYFSKFCCVCLDRGQKLEELLTIQKNGLSYYDILLTLIPEMDVKQIKEVAFICEDCKESTDNMYKFRTKCLSNNNTLKKYISQLRLYKNDIFSGTNIFIKKIVIHDDLNEPENEQKSENRSIKNKVNIIDSCIQNETFSDIECNESLSESTVEENKNNTSFKINIDDDDDECIKTNDVDMNVIDPLEDQTVNVVYENEFFSSAEDFELCTKHFIKTETIVCDQELFLKEESVDVTEASVSENSMVYGDDEEKFDDSIVLNNVPIVSEYDSGFINYKNLSFYVNGQEEDYSVVAENSFYVTNSSNNRNINQDEDTSEKNKRNNVRVKDYCCYCKDLVLNFARHIIRKHSTEDDVIKISSQPKGSKERKSLIAKLRKQGNYLNIGTAQKAVKKPHLTGELSPCTNCLGLYASKQLWRHRKKCCGTSDRKHKVNGQNLLLKNSKIDLKLQEEVFPRMRPDQISFQAKQDELICAFAASYIRIHQEKRFVVVASRKMRELSKLVIEIKKKVPSVRNLFEALHPKYFDVIVEATKIIARYNEGEESYGAPSLAMNIGTTLKQCCDLAIVHETVSGTKTEENLKSMIHLIEDRWRYEISKKADGLNVKKPKKMTLIQLASDIKILKEHLLITARNAIVLLNNNNEDKDAYLTLLETIFCRVLLLNRCRPGELQRLRLDAYEKTDRNEEFLDVMTPLEQILTKSLKRVVIKENRGRSKLVLFSLDVQEHINILVRYQKVFNVDDLYLFENPNTLEPLCGYKILKKYATSSGARNPESITSTRLRNDLVTLTQLFNMNDADIQQLTTFLGHTVENGSNTLLNDIHQIVKLIKLIEKDTDETVERHDFRREDLQDNEDLRGLTENSVCNVSGRRKSRILVPWTEEQKNILRNHFDGHIKRKRPPKQAECLELKERNPIVFQNKDWLKIKVYIQNIYSKKVKKNSYFISKLSRMYNSLRKLAKKRPYFGKNW